MIHSPNASHNHVICTSNPLPPAHGGQVLCHAIRYGPAADCGGALAGTAAEDIIAGRRHRQARELRSFAALNCAWSALTALLSETTLRLRSSAPLSAHPPHTPAQLRLVQDPSLVLHTSSCLPGKQHGQSK